MHICLQVIVTCHSLWACISPSFIFDISNYLYLFLQAWGPTCPDRDWQPGLDLLMQARRSKIPGENYKLITVVSILTMTLTYWCRLRDRDLLQGTEKVVVVVSVPTTGSRRDGRPWWWFRTRGRCCGCLRLCSTAPALSTRSTSPLTNSSVSSSLGPGLTMDSKWVYESTSSANPPCLHPLNFPFTSSSSFAFSVYPFTLSPSSSSAAASSPTLHPPPLFFFLFFSSSFFNSPLRLVFFTSASSSSHYPSSYSSSSSSYYSLLSFAVSIYSASPFCVSRPRFFFFFF